MIKPRPTTSLFPKARPAAVDARAPGRIKITTVSRAAIEALVVRLNLKVVVDAAA